MPFRVSRVYRVNIMENIFLKNYKRKKSSKDVKEISSVHAQKWNKYFYLVFFLGYQYNVMYMRHSSPNRHNRDPHYF